MEHAGALWRDEISTVLVAASEGLGSMYWNQATDSFPILFALLLRFWMGINPRADTVLEQDLWVRCFGAICGLFLAIVLLRPIFRKNPRLPFFSLALFLFSAPVVVWGDSLRAYGLGSALVILFASQVKKIVTETNQGFPLKSVFLGVVSAWTLYGNLFLITGLCMAGIITCFWAQEWKKIRDLLLIGVLSCASLLLNLPIIFQMIKIKDLVDHHVDIYTAASVFFEFISGGGGVQMYAWIVSTLIFLAVCLVRIIQKRHHRESEAQSAAFSFSAFFLCSGLHLFYVLQVGQVPQVWYFIPLGGLMVYFFDSSLRMTECPRVAWPTIFLILFSVLGLNLASDSVILRKSMTNLDLVTETISKSSSSGDIFLVADPFQASTVLRYAPEGTDVQVWPSSTRDQMKAQGKIPLLTRMKEGDQAIEHLLNHIENRLRLGGTLWFFGQPAVLNPQAEPPSTLAIPHTPNSWKPGPFLFCWNAQTTAFLLRNTQIQERSHIFDVSSVSHLESIDTVFRFRGLKNANRLSQ